MSATNPEDYFPAPTIVVSANKRCRVHVVNELSDVRCEGRLAHLSERTHHVGATDGLRGPRCLVQPRSPLEHPPLPQYVPPVRSGHVSDTLTTHVFADSTVLHTHGLHVSTYDDNIDTNVLPGESLTYNYSVPSDHLPGTHWCVCVCSWAAAVGGCSPPAAMFVGSGTTPTSTAARPFRWRAVWLAPCSLTRLQTTTSTTR